MHTTLWRGSPGDGVRVWQHVSHQRREKGLTQAEVARQAGVTKEYVTMLERGGRTSPSLAVLGRVARALGVPITELLAPPKGGRLRAK